MCSRYQMVSSPETVRDYLGTVNDEQFPPRIAIAPTQPVLIARLDIKGERRLELVRWGLIPGWAKDPRTLALLFNAQAETALAKPTYRAGVTYRRCLVPADAYYAWSGPKSARIAHLVAPCEPGPMAFAGIWDHWLGADGSEMESMAILTVAAGTDVADVAERMPAIVRLEDFGSWLDCRGCPADDAVQFLNPTPAGSLRVQRLSPTPLQASTDVEEDPTT